MQRISAFLLLIVLCAVSASVSAQQALYYFKIDSRWYSATSGTVALDTGGNLIDAPGVVLQQSCRRASGAAPPLGTHTALLGTAIFDVVYTDQAFRVHATTPPTVEIRTPSGDVQCGAGVTPPQAVIDGVNNPGSPVSPMFSNGFEAP